MQKRQQLASSSNPRIVTGILVLLTVFILKSCTFMQQVVDRTTVHITLSESAVSNNIMNANLFMKCNTMYMIL
jgi:hypothetical protein